MTNKERNILKGKVLTKTLTLEDVYFMCLDSISPYVEVISGRVHTHITDTEFVIKVVSEERPDVKWVEIGKVEADAIRVYSYHKPGTTPDIQTWNTSE